MQNLDKKAVQATLRAMNTSFINWGVEHKAERALSTIVRASTLFKQALKGKQKFQLLLQNGIFKIFGAGWNKVLLVYDTEQLKIHEQNNQDSPVICYLSFHNQAFEVTALPDIKSIDSFAVRAVLNEKGDLHEKQFVFKAEDQKSTIKYFLLFRQIIENSTGIKNKRFYLSSVDKFYKYKSVHATQLESQVDCGDCLLYNIKSEAAKFIRLITISSCDHVALTIVNNDNEMLMLDSTGNEGVGIMSFKDFIKGRCYRNLNKLSIRRLKVAERIDKQFYKRLQTILNGCLGLDYEINFEKLFGKGSILRKDKSLQERIKQLKIENRTFFCSQLVAFFYKNLGYLPQEVGSNSYWPRSFEQSNQLKWVGGASLGPEQIICFDDEECKRYASS